jgi:hypothetical protein
MEISLANHLVFILNAVFFWLAWRSFKPVALITGNHFALKRIQRTLRSAQIRRTPKVQRPTKGRRSSDVALNELRLLQSELSQSTGRAQAELLSFLPALALSGLVLMAAYLYLPATLSTNWFAVPLGLSGCRHLLIALNSSSHKIKSVLSRALLEKRQWFYTTRSLFEILTALAFLVLH